MPIFRHNGDLHYFAHIPKAGGRSVEAYLRARFGTLSMIDDGTHDRTPKTDWLRTTPQHVTADDLAVLIPPDWFASAFAVVRHPIQRLVSAFNFQSTTWRQIPVGMGISEWFDEYCDLSRVYSYYYDNHLRPQTDFIPEGAEVFQLETGMNDIVPFLDRATKSNAPKLKIEHLNTSRPEPGSYYRTETLTRPFLDKLVAYYQRDFDEFGYDPALEQEYRVFMPTARGGGELEKRRARGKSLMLRRGWRQVVKRTGVPVFMF